MGSPRSAAPFLLLLLLFIGLAASAGIGCPYLPHWSTHCLLASQMTLSLEGLPMSLAMPSWRFLRPQSLAVLSSGSAPICACIWCQILQRKLLSSCCLSEKGHHIAVPSPHISHKGLRSKRTQPSDPKALEGLPRSSSQRHEGPEFSFDLLPEARAIQVTVPPGPEVTVRLCHQWVLECEELSSPFDAQFSFGNSSHVECPHRTGEPISDPGWDPLPPLHPYPTVTKPDAIPVLTSLATTAQLLSLPTNKMSPMMPFPTLAAPSWNVSVDTQAQQLVLHFSSMMQATFSAAWSHPSLGQDSLVPPVYSISQAQGSSPVTLDLIIPFLQPGSCLLVWRSDVQFSWKHLLCPDVSHRHLGLWILALLALTTLLGIVLVLTRRRPLSGPGRERPVLLLHVADSEAQRRLVGALAELLRAALGGGRDVIVDLWEGTRVARVGPLPWLWAARTRVAQERGTVLLLWSIGGPSPVRGRDPHSAPLRALLGAAPRPLLLLAYFSRLCAKGDIPPPLRALPRYRLLRDLPRLLRALDAQPSTEATNRGRLGDRPCLRGRLELCHRLEREAAKFCPPSLSRDRRRGTGWNP
ncbi:interleukin-17 receptor E isoform X8 [Ailuropoda melanoleuca]|uniref:interleukin-17 receptor E isoform X8 n=1 Tax=Ailuropoda melanoleuca TaxID=9646 RepID=UPI001494011D|nr:interleukin-17 receptor E isoform X8 [Ailuropoda melanoleuca]